MRLAVLRLAVILAAFAVGSAELLSAVGSLAGAPALRWWSVAPLWLVVAGALGWRLWRHRAAVAAAARTRLATRIDPVFGAGLAGLAGLLGLELLAAVSTRPNTWDAQTYHLPRVEHWVANGSVDFYPTGVARQDALPPGAEYLLLHLRLLTGGEALAGLVQFLALLICLAATTRITAQLGGGRRAQLATALLIASAPLVVLEASSTQTDLVLGAWVTVLATLVLDGFSQPATRAEIVFLGLATGLVAVTKTNGLAAVVVLLALWAGRQLRHWGWGRGQSRIVIGRVSLATLVIVGLVVVLAGPYLVRMTLTYGGPVDPEFPITLQRHDPAAILVNALRIGDTALEPPALPTLSRGMSDAVVRVARAVGVDPSDPAITYAGPYPEPAALNEDRASFPIAGALTLVAALVALARPRWLSTHATRVRSYAAVAAGALLLHVGTLMWQPWGNRLLLPVLLLAAPLAGLWLGAGRSARRWSATPAAMLLAGTLAVGVHTVGWGEPRPLAGLDSIPRQDDLAQVFRERPDLMAPYLDAAQRVDATGATHVGLITGEDSWEYPFWWLLPGRDFVALSSAVPHHPAAPVDSVTVVLCLDAPQACAAIVPADWTRQTWGSVTVVTRWP